MVLNWEWWHTEVITEIGRLMEGDYKFRASLGNFASLVSKIVECLPSMYRAGVPSAARGNKRRIKYITEVKLPKRMQ